MADHSFPGFPAEGMQFLRSLERNNKREWFQPRKEIFDSQVKAPMVALVEAVNRALGKFAPDYICDPAQAIYRIYRDTRFSSDKTPYKTHIAASFPKRGLHKHAAGAFYFGVSPKEVELAGGVYMPGPDEILAIRRHLSENYAEASKLLANPKLKKLAGELQGSELVRVPKGFSADDPAAALIRKKQWFFYVLMDSAMITTPDLLKEIVDRFRVLAPIVEFMNVPLKTKRMRPEDLLI